MTIFGMMLSTFMITLGVLLAGLATNGRFGPPPSFFYQAEATATALPNPVKSATPAAQVHLQPAKTRFVTIEPAPAPIPVKAKLDRPANPPTNPVTQADRKTLPKMPQQQAAWSQAPKPHPRPAASGWSWNWPLFGN